MTEVQIPTRTYGTGGWWPSRYRPHDRAGALNEITTRRTYTRTSRRPPTGRIASTSPRATTTSTATPVPHLPEPLRRTP
jgi:hypothetical protein